MKKVAKFTKVSYDQFSKDMHDCFDDCRKFTEDEIKDIYANIKLPTRATSGSAGYDFRSPIDFELAPGSDIKLPTGIRCEMKNGYFLMCCPRSGLGFKFKQRLWNTLGVIASDYSQSPNEGHIMAKISNESDPMLNKVMTIKAGDAFIQGIIMKFYITEDDDVTAKRDGGFGSTGR